MKTFIIKSDTHFNITKNNHAKPKFVTAFCATSDNKIPCNVNIDIKSSKDFVRFEKDYDMTIYPMRGEVEKEDVRIVDIIYGKTSSNYSLKDAAKKAENIVAKTRKSNR